MEVYRSVTRVYKTQFRFKRAAKFININYGNKVDVMS